MSEADRWYELEDEITRAMRNRAAAALLLPDVIAGMPPETWNDLIAEGRAAIGTVATEGGEAQVAVGSADADLGTLKEDSTQIRNAGMKRFKRKDPTRFKTFQAIPVDADADEDIVSRAVKAAAWELTPDGATWQAVVGKNLTTYQADITTCQTKLATRAKERTEASAAGSDRNAKAVEIHDTNVMWYGTAIGAYPRNSPKWNTVNGTIQHEDTTGTSGGMVVPPRDPVP